MSEVPPGSTPVLVSPDDVPVDKLNTSSRDVFKRLDNEVDGTKYWPHFGEELLDLNAVQLREFERAKSPCLAIIDKWMALNPSGRLGKLSSVLKAIERDDVALVLKATVMKSKAYRDLVAPLERSTSCPSRPSHDNRHVMMSQLSLDETRQKDYPSAPLGVGPQTTGPMWEGRLIPRQEMQGLASPLTDEYVVSPAPPIQVHVNGSIQHHSLCLPRPVVQLHNVYDAIAHLYKCTSPSVHVCCEIRRADTHDLIASSSLPPSSPHSSSMPECLVLRDISGRLELSPAHPSPSVTVGTYISARITTNRPCFIYVINIGTSGKQTLLLPNGSSPSIYVTAGKAYDITGMLISGPTGMEVLKVLASSLDLTSVDLPPLPVMRDITLQQQTSVSWSSISWGMAEVAFTVFKSLN